MVEKQKSNRNALWEADIDFVFKEAARIHKVLEKGDTPLNLMLRADLEGSLPHPNGGSLMYGLAAEQKIWGIVEGQE